METRNPSEIWRSAAPAAHGSVIPCLQYDDAKAAIDWLVNAFGFTAHLVVDGEGGRIEHAQLTHGTGMVMLSSSKQPPVALASTYIVIDNPDAHCATARAAGAEILREPVDEDYGGRHYSARDPQGHQWHFGSYDPFAEPSKLVYEEDDASATIEIRVAGRVTAGQFEGIARRMEAFLERHESVRLIEVIERFDGMDLSLLFDDVLFSLRHMRRFSHVAVVTDLRWAEKMANAAAIVLSARVRLFPLDSLADARNWARSAA